MIRLPRLRLLVLAALSTVVMLVLTSVSGSAADARPGTTAPKPTIVLVHGAFADASSWTGPIQNLQHRGYTVYAPANPLRGLASDADSIRTFLSTIPGPIVLVGHSYGGAVITNAATGNPNVKALVYIAAYIPAEGETLGQAGELGGGTSLLAQHIVVRPIPGSSTDADGSIDPAAFREVFAADLPAQQSAVLAATQRPIALSALGTPSGAPAWKTIPSWALVARNDRAIAPEAERAMALRTHAHTVEIRSSHVALISHPDAVTDLILAAAH
jgi:pimeloyl-ACP methyl ester carboxylesterase